ncbi:MAG: CehA/McbA family metallohydrolase [Clostridia bacterium]|nr:CehA/McbA family metallohydrolase [Clostridia bacterium]
MYIDSNNHHWYKGNLHTHTTRSDGRRTPEETCALYAAAGYDFLALTDHWKLGEGCERDENGLLILSGAEYNFNGEDVLAGVFHIVGVGMESDPMAGDSPLTRESSAQQAIDAINACGGAAILAHPAWSLNTWDQIMPLERFAATEIFNSVSDLPRNARPYSGVVVDQLAARGRILPLIADDDTHFHIGEQTRSYIWVDLVDAPLTRENLMAAIRAGRYYGTQGPRFSWHLEEREGKRTFVVDVDAPADGEAEICRVTFFTNRPWMGDRTTLRDGAPLRQAVCHPTASDTFIRAEIADAAGNVGWTQIVKL